MSRRDTDCKRTGWGLSLPNFQLDERLRKQRRWLHTSLYAKSALDRAEPAQTRGIRVLLSGLLESPENYSEHLHRSLSPSIIVFQSDDSDGTPRYTTSVMMDVVYGHTVTAEDDKYLHIASEALRGTTEVAAAGANIVDFMPSCESVAFDLHYAARSCRSLYYSTPYTRVDAWCKVQATC